MKRPELSSYLVVVDHIQLQCVVDKNDVMLFCEVFRREIQFGNQRHEDVVDLSLPDILISSDFIKLVLHVVQIGERVLRL